MFFVTSDVIGQAGSAAPQSRKEPLVCPGPNQWPGPLSPVRPGPSERPGLRSPVPTWSSRHPHGCRRATHGWLLLVHLLVLRSLAQLLAPRSPAHLLAPHSLPHRQALLSVAHLLSLHLLTPISLAHARRLTPRSLVHRLPGAPAPWCIGSLLVPLSWSHPLASLALVCMPALRLLAHLLVPRSRVWCARRSSAESSTSGHGYLRCYFMAVFMFLTCLGMDPMDTRIEQMTVAWKLSSSSAPGAVGGPVRPGQASF